MKTGRISLLLLTLSLVVVVLSAPDVVGSASAPVAGGSAVTDSPATDYRLLTTDYSPIFGPPQPIVTYSTRNDVSPPLRSIAPVPPVAEAEAREIPLLLPPRRGGHAPGQQRALGAPVLQDQPVAPNMPPPIQSFEGVSNVNYVYPPDTQGDVGPDHYVQWVNLSFAIWDKNGNLLYGPANGNTLWTGFGGPCETENDGDPITLYDPLAGRWFMSQFALPDYSGPFYQCIAVSQTGDPTGDWYRYEFVIPINKMNDYPKFGVWPDAYYMSVNQFVSGFWAGVGVAAFERDKMVNGKVARMVYFDVGDVTLDYSSMLPADLDGFRRPPGGSPNYFAEWDDSVQLGDPTDSLRLWEFHVDWADPANSTFGLAGYVPNVLLPTADVDPDMCGFSRACIPQPGTTNRVDAISDRLMYRLQYRNFGDYETLVTNHTVDVDATDHAGIHWVELRRSQGGDWDVYQEGVYAPDADHRWMGSIAMDHMGNIALGYSVSSGATFPSIRYTGRLAGDPSGVMAQGEVELIAGTGSQTYSNRWGDYSMMAVDPVDDCTFWYTQEYYETSGGNWQTRIGSFKFPSCTAGPQGTLAGVVYEQGGTPETDPIADALVRVSFSPTWTLQATTDVDGYYIIRLPIGAYTTTAMAYGYQPSIGGVNIFSGTTTVLDVPLTPVATYVVSGFVTDDATGWPLYAHITVRGNPVDPPAPYDDFWNDPVTGHYSVTLAGGIVYTFTVEVWTPGYLPAGRDVGPLAGDRVEDWAMDADSAACAGLGYSPDYAYAEDFEADDGGYIHSGPHDEWEWGTPTTWPDGCASGNRCWGTDLNGYYESNSDQTLYSPLIDLSGIPTGTMLIARWWQAWSVESYAMYDPLFVEISINGDLWTKIWSRTEEESQVDWTEMGTDVSAAAGGSVQFRWRLISDSYSNYEGLYVDDVTVASGCVPPDGGLVVGNVYDANTSAPLPGASVASDRGEATTALPTPGDPAVDDAFYTLFSPAGSHTLATTMDRYGLVEVSVTVVQNDTVRQDFYLPAGWLFHDPAGYDVTLQMGARSTVPLTLTNAGGVAAAFELTERDEGYTPGISADSSTDDYAPPGPVLAILEGTTGPIEGWEPSDTPPDGRYDTVPDDLALSGWGVGTPIPTGGQYAGAGLTADGETFYLIGGDGYGGCLDQNLRYDPATGTWDQSLAVMPTARMNVSAYYDADDGMIYVPGGYSYDYYGGYYHNELEAYDPASDSWIVLSPLPFAKSGANGGIVDGRLYLFGGNPWPYDEIQIYDIASDTWFGGTPIPTPHVYGADVTYEGYIYVIGGWGETTFYRYDPAADTWEAGPPLNVARQSPSAVVSDGGVVYVWGGGTEWSPLYDGEYYDLADWPGGSWTRITNDDIPWPNIRAAHVCASDLLWVEGGSPAHDANQNWSGVERCYWPTGDVPWLSEDPISGTVPALFDQVVDVTFDAAASEVTQPGRYHAQIGIEHDTPYDAINVPVTMTVLPPSGWGGAEGVVTSLGYCDTNPFPLEGAAVLITGTSGVTWTLATDANGAYHLWLEVSHSPLTIVISHPDYTTTVMSNVIITDQVVTRRDVDWRWPQPCVSVAPTSISVTLEADDTVTKKLTISNDGAVATAFRLREVETDAMASTCRTVQDERVPSPRISGGPDTFGYTYKDSNESDGPIYDWADISATGVPVFLGDDDGDGPFLIGFTFNFYGNDYTEFYISSNGYLSFNDLDLTDYGNDCPLPNAFDPDDSIYLMWGDLYPSNPVFYQTFADCPYSGGLACLVVQYENFYYYGGQVAGSFEAVLFENGSILIQFEDAGEQGAWSTTGIENSDATDGLTYACNAPGSLHDNLSVCFAYPGESSDCTFAFVDEVSWLSESPVAGTVDADGDYVVNVTVVTPPIMPHGVYAAALEVRTGDVVSPQIRIPVTLTVSGPWEKRVYVNDALTTKHPIVIIPNDVVQVVDRIEVTHTEQVTFTLLEDWTEPLSLLDYAVVAQPGGTAGLPGGTAGFPSEVITGDGVLTWTIAGQPGDWGYVITKTFDIVGDDWSYGYVTEKLWMGGGTAIPPHQRVVRFMGTSFDVYLPVLLKGF